MAAVTSVEVVVFIDSLGLLRRPTEALLATTLGPLVVLVVATSIARVRSIALATLAAGAVAAAVALIPFAAVALLIVFFAVLFRDRSVQITSTLMILPLVPLAGLLGLAATRAFWRTAPPRSRRRDAVLGIAAGVAMVGIGSPPFSRRGHPVAR